jgi:hypothetical protein
MAASASTPRLPRSQHRLDHTPEVLKQQSILPSSEDRWDRRREEIGELYLLSSLEGRGMFSQQYTRQLSNSPPPFNHASLAVTESHARYIYPPPYSQQSNSPPPFNHASLAVTESHASYICPPSGPSYSQQSNAYYNMPPTMDIPLYHSYMQPLHNRQQAYAATGIATPPIKQEFYAEDEINPFSMSYASIAGVDVSTTVTPSYQDVAAAYVSTTAAATGFNINENETRENQKLREQLRDSRYVSDPHGITSEAPRDKLLYNNGAPPATYYQIPTDGGNSLSSYMLPRLTSEEHHERYLDRRGIEPTRMEDHVDSITAIDSGYRSGTRYSCTNPGEGNLIDTDTDSVATDGWPSSLPRQDKYMLEAEFAREMFNRSSVQTRERFAERGETVMDLLYSFSVMIGGRASSAAERGAASFVRRGRKYVSPNPDPSRLSLRTRADSTGAY